MNFLKVPNNQQGLLTIFSLLMIVLLVGSIAAGSYFLQNRFSIAPKASEEITDQKINDNQQTKNPENTYLYIEVKDPKTGQQIYNWLKDDQLWIDIFVRADSDPVNLIQAELEYPKDLLLIKKIIKNESETTHLSTKFVVKYWVEEVIDKRDGVVSLIGAIPNPGFKTEPKSKPLLVARVLAKVKSIDHDLILNFSPNSALFSNTTNKNIIEKTEPWQIQNDSKKAQLPSYDKKDNSGIKGDIDNNGTLECADITALNIQMKDPSTQSAQADINGDAKVNSFDLSRLISLLPENCRKQE